MPRRVRGHLVLFAVSAVLSSIVFAAVRSDHLPFRISMTTAYVSMILLVAALVIGPLNVLRGRPNPVSTNVRRDIAIWGGSIGLLHVVAGLFVHLRGKMWQYFVDPTPRWPAVPIRFDPFGFANYAGVIAAGILVLLLALSNDASLRRLRPPRWKSLQRLNYVAMALIVAHGIVYQLTENRSPAFIAAFATLVIVAGVAQAVGYRTLRARATRLHEPLESGV